MLAQRSGVIDESARADQSSGEKDIQILNWNGNLAELARFVRARSAGRPGGEERVRTD